MARVREGGAIGTMALGKNSARRASAAAAKGPALAAQARENADRREAAARWNATREKHIKRKVRVCCNETLLTLFVPSFSPFN